MRGPGSLGFPTFPLPVQDNARTEFVLIQRTLGRLLAFTGHSIDDLVNDQIVKNKVLGYYKLHKHIERRSEVLELERQWNILRVTGPPAEPFPDSSGARAVDANNASG